MDLRYAKRSEETEQIRVVQWANRAREEYKALRWLYHIPNGGKRGKAEAQVLKQMGVKAGVSDLFLPYPRGKYHGMYIEMKYGKNTTTTEQEEFLTDMQEYGYFVCICYSAEAAQEMLISYMNLKGQQEILISEIKREVRINRNKLPVVK